MGRNEFNDGNEPNFSLDNFKRWLAEQGHPVDDEGHERCDKAESEDDLKQRFKDRIKKRRRKRRQSDD